MVHAAQQQNTVNYKNTEMTMLERGMMLEAHKKRKEKKVNALQEL